MQEDNTKFSPDDLDQIHEIMSASGCDERTARELLHLLAGTQEKIERELSTEKDRVTIGRND